MLKALLARFPRQRGQLRTAYYRGKQKLVDTFRSYGSEEFGAALYTLGVRPGDTLMVHSGFNRLSGFKGSPSEIVDTLVAAVGPDGHLLMVSMAYMSSAYDYLKQRKVFDVRKTVSHMGIVSETFRRRAGVLRSMHPSNPVLAYGPRAEWIVGGHENCVKPCGAGSPFEKIAQLHSKVLFYDASIYTQTFFHYLEDMLEDQLDFPLFRDELMEAAVVDYDGNTRIVRTYVYSEEAIKRRRPKIMTDELERQKLVKRARVGNSQLMLICTDDVLRVVRNMAENGVFFYE
jgi:aminoglycoside 3-N-acetyltransferase